MGPSPQDLDLCCTWSCWCWGWSCRRTWWPSAFGVVGIFNSLSVLEGRRRNREDVSYNLLWGQLALTIFLVACAVLAVRQRMGL